MFAKSTLTSAHTTLAVVWLRRLVFGLCARRPQFDPRLVLVGFMVDRVAVSFP